MTAATETLVLTVVVLGVAFGLVSCDVLTPSQYLACENVKSTGIIKEVRFANCPAVPCQMKQRSSAGLEIDFTVAAPVEEIDVHTFGVIAGVDIPFAGVDSHGCNYTTGPGGVAACPITDTTKVYTYKYEVKVKNYPTIPVDIKYELDDARNPLVNIVCVKIPAEIVPGDPVKN